MFRKIFNFILARARGHGRDIERLEVMNRKILATNDEIIAAMKENYVNSHHNELVALKFGFQSAEYGWNFEKTIDEWNKAVKPTIN